jgi:hypothetical protein
MRDDIVGEQQPRQQQELTPLILASRGRSDADLAAELRAAAEPHLTALCGLMRDAARDGLALNWSIGPNPWGVPSVQSINVVKPL